MVITVKNGDKRIVSLLRKYMEPLEAEGHRAEYYNGWSGDMSKLDEGYYNVFVKGPKKGVLGRREKLAHIRCGKNDYAMTINYAEKSLSGTMEKLAEEWENEFGKSKVIVSENF